MLIFWLAKIGYETLGQKMIDNLWNLTIIFS